MTGVTDDANEVHINDLVWFRDVNNREYGPCRVTAINPGATHPLRVRCPSGGEYWIRGGDFLKAAIN